MKKDIKSTVSHLSGKLDIISKKQLKHLYSNYKGLAQKKGKKLEQPMQNMKLDVIGNNRDIVNSSHLCKA